MKKILFIEDDPRFQKLLKEMFAGSDFTIVAAFDGEEGLARTKEDNPDLILLDLVLPKKSGLEVLKVLKQESNTKDIPVIVLTNLETPEQIEEVMGLGASAYLVKTDYTPQELRQKIDEMLK